MELKVGGPAIAVPAVYVPVNVYSLLTLANFLSGEPSRKPKDRLKLSFIQPI